MAQIQWNLFNKMAWAVVLGLAVTGAPASAAEGFDKPNIILIMADDLGVEGVGCYGGVDYRTPHLDRLAAEGMRFTHCYSQPLCTPSRVQIMTGRYNLRNYEGFGYLNPLEITFGNILKRAGYATCIAGKWQLSGDADTVKRFGFDEHCLWNMIDYRKPGLKPSVTPYPSGHLQRYASPVLFVNGVWREGGDEEYGPQVAADFLCSFIDRNKGRSFFCYYPMILTHSPFVPTPDSEPATRESTPTKGQKGRGRKKRGGGSKAHFTDMVAYMDKIVGQIMEQLDRSGVLDNTLVLFTGDNGTHTSITSSMGGGKKIKGGKAHLSQAGTHVPLIAYWKSTTPEGTVNDNLIDFTDFFVTLADAAGASLPKDRKIDGMSFLPQIRGTKSTPREWVFFHYWGYGRDKSKARSLIRNKTWKMFDGGTPSPVERRQSAQSQEGAKEVQKRFQDIMDRLKR